MKDLEEGDGGVHMYVRMSKEKLNYVHNFLKKI
jgi:hypothetical protein